MTPASAPPAPVPAANFDRLARIYRGLEFLAFGRDLERCRFCFLDQLADRERILVLGEGDGRCLERLVQIAPRAEIHCVDASAAMLARAQQRIGPHRRVRFIHADALKLDLPAGHYDAVTTLFFLDCFSNHELATLVARLERSLAPDTKWLFGDFVVPPSGWRRWRGRIWLAVLYTFFRCQTGIVARVLPDSEPMIHRAGFGRASVRDFQHGLLRSALYSRRPSATAGSAGGS